MGESIVYRSIVVSQWRVLHTGCVGSVLGDRRLGPSEQHVASLQ